MNCHQMYVRERDGVFLSALRMLLPVWPPKVVFIRCCRINLKKKRRDLLFKALRVPFQLTMRHREFRGDDDGGHSSGSLTISRRKIGTMCNRI